MGRMSPERKKLQDKLRRKFGYSTNTNYNRGCILIKGDTSQNAADAPGSKLMCEDEKGRYYPVTDLSFIMDYYPIEKAGQFGINITLYKDYGLGVPEDKRFIEAGDTTAYISLEELDIIHEIAHKMYDEHKKWWDNVEKF